MAIFSPLDGFLPTAKSELMLPRADMKAMLAAKPVGHTRQLWRKKKNFFQECLKDCACNYEVGSYIMKRAAGKSKRLDSLVEKNTKAEMTMEWRFPYLEISKQRAEIKLPNKKRTISLDFLFWFIVVISSTIIIQPDWMIRNLTHCIEFEPHTVFCQVISFSNFGHPRYQNQRRYPTHHWKTPLRTI